MNETIAAARVIWRGLAPRLVARELHVPRLTLEDVVVMMNSGLPE
jgi:hypothetical protein